MEFKKTRKFAEHAIDVCNGFEDSIFNAWSECFDGSWFYNYHTSKLELIDMDNRKHVFSDSVNAVKYCLSDFIDNGMIELYYCMENNHLYTIDELQSMCDSDPLNNGTIDWFLDITQNYYHSLKKI